MEKPKYQLLKRAAKGEPWRFVAHGAQYSGAEALEMEKAVKANGGLFRKLKV